MMAEISGQEVVEEPTTPKSSTFFGGEANDLK